MFHIAALVGLGVVAGLTSGLIGIGGGDRHRSGAGALLRLFPAAGPGDNPGPDGPAPGAAGGLDLLSPGVRGHQDSRADLPRLCAGECLGSRPGSSSPHGTPDADFWCDSGDNRVKDALLGMTGLGTSTPLTPPPFTLRQAQGERWRPCLNDIFFDSPGFPPCYVLIPLDGDGGFPSDIMTKNSSTTRGSKPFPAWSRR